MQHLNAAVSFSLFKNHIKCIKATSRINSFQTFLSEKIKCFILFNNHDINMKSSTIKFLYDENHHLLPFRLFFLPPFSVRESCVFCDVARGTACPVVLMCSNSLLREGKTWWHIAHTKDSFTWGEKNKTNQNEKQKHAGLRQQRWG